MRKMRKQKKWRLTCSFMFCGSEAIHPSTRALTFSTSTSKTPSPDTIATICKYSAIAEGDEAREISSHPMIVVSTCNFFIFSFLYTPLHTGQCDGIHFWRHLRKLAVFGCEPLTGAITGDSLAAENMSTGDGVRSPFTVVRLVADVATGIRMYHKHR